MTHLQSHQTTDYHSDATHACIQKVRARNLGSPLAYSSSWTVWKTVFWKNPCGETVVSAWRCAGSEREEPELRIWKRNARVLGHVLHDRLLNTARRVTRTHRYRVKVSAAMLRQQIRCKYIQTRYFSKNTPQSYPLVCDGIYTNACDGIGFHATTSTILNSESIYLTDHHKLETINSKYLQTFGVCSGRNLRPSLPQRLPTSL